MIEQKLAESRLERRILSYLRQCPCAWVSMETLKISLACRSLVQLNAAVASLREQDVIEYNHHEWLRLKNTESSQRRGQ